MSTDWFATMRGITADYVKRLDLKQSVPNERFSCCDCHHVGPLNIHGQCEACGSNAVQAWELIQGGVRK
jgi:hypothetical protein